MGGRKQLGETASKKQKKSDIELPTADTLRSAPDGLPERLKHQHKFVTCGADVNVHVGDISLDMASRSAYTHVSPLPIHLLRRRC
jgi:hypothetical protein